MTAPPIILDATVVVDHLRGHPVATGSLVVNAYGERRLRALATTRAEILLSALPHEVAATRRLLDRIEWISITEDLVDEAVALVEDWPGPPTRAEPLDLLVEATVRRLRGRLLTSDPSRYPHIPDLHAAYTYR